MWVVVFLFLAAFGIVHQHLLLYYIFQVDDWMDWAQLWHHEALIGMCLSIAAWELVRPLLNKIVKHYAQRALRKEKYD